MVLKWLAHITILCSLLCAPCTSALALNDSLWKEKKENYYYPPLDPPKVEQTQVQRNEDKVDKPEAGTSDLTRFFRIAAFVLISLLLIYLIWYAMKKTESLKEDRKETGPSWESLEALDPHAPELQALLLQAQDADDPLAIIRIQFLQWLKILHDQKMIQWSANKTNESLGLEISDEQNRLLYFNLLDIYQPYWYGKLRPSRAIVNRWKALISLKLDQTESDA